MLKKKVLGNIFLKFFLFKNLNSKGKQRGFCEDKYLLSKVRENLNYFK